MVKTLRIQFNKNNKKRKENWLLNETHRRRQTRWNSADKNNKRIVAHNETKRNRREKNDNENSSIDRRTSRLRGVAASYWSAVRRSDGRRRCRHEDGAENAASRRHLVPPTAWSFFLYVFFFVQNRVRPWSDVQQQRERERERERWGGEEGDSLQ